MSILTLPKDIHSRIKEYTNINRLLNTTARLKNEKHELYYWKLKKNIHLNIVITQSLGIW